MRFVLFSLARWPQLVSRQADRSVSLQTIYIQIVLLQGRWS